MVTGHPFSDSLRKYYSIYIFKIKPDRDLEPMNTDDTEKITRLLDTSNRTFSITDAGGNNMGLMRVVSSTVSSYASLNMVNW